MKWACLCSFFVLSRKRAKPGKMKKRPGLKINNEDQRSKVMRICVRSSGVSIITNEASTSQQNNTHDTSSSSHSEEEHSRTEVGTKTSSFSESTSDSSSPSSSSSSNEENGIFQNFISDVFTGEESDATWRTPSMESQASNSEHDVQASPRNSDSPVSNNNDNDNEDAEDRYETKGTSWEGPLMYLPMLSRLRVRQSEKNLRPLEKLCLQCVSDNLSYFIKQGDPFSSLPGRILQLLTRFLEQEETLLDHKVLPLVITPRTEYLPLNLQKPPKFKGDFSTVFWTQDFVHLFEKMQLCKKSLKFLEFHLSLPDFLSLSAVKYPTIEDLDLSLAGMPNLQELTLDIGAATDETVTVIASTCANLKKLDLDGNEKVTNKGINYLCNEKSCCKELEYLSLNGTQVNAHGIASVLENLPQLRHLWKDDILTESLKIYWKNNIKPLNLDSISPSYIYYNLKAMPDNTKLFKSASELDLSKHSAFSLFSEVPNVTSVLYSDKNFVSNSKEPILYSNVILYYNIQITKLHIAIYNQAVVDFSLIGYTCINLESFTYQLNNYAEHTYFRHLTTVSKPQYTLDDKIHFKKLKEFEIQNCTGRHFSYQIEAVKMMLSSPVLESVSMNQCCIPGVVFSSVIDEAKLNENVLSNIQKLYFKNCEFTFAIIKSLICFAPNLKKIFMIRCNDPIDVWINMKESIGWFITQNRLNIDLVFISR